MQDLIQYLCRQITGNDTITVDESKEEDIWTYTIVAPKETMGLLIGKEGRTIKALRTLARTRAIVENKNINVQLQETA